MILATLLLAASAHAGDLVDFKKVHPKAVLDIRYATTNNFTKKKVYPTARCLLRPAVARRLKAAAQEFEARGLRLKILDCFRPLAVQKVFWSMVPDERYVADPKKGSRHNRGAAVDVTLDGREMPSEWDDFSEKAHRDYEKASPKAKENRALLEAVMGRHGFVGLPTEWWHFDAQGWEEYPLE